MAASSRRRKPDTAPCFDRYALATRRDKAQAVVTEVKITGKVRMRMAAVSASTFVSPLRKTRRTHS